MNCARELRFLQVSDLIHVLPDPACDICVPGRIEVHSVRVDEGFVFIVVDFVVDVEDSNTHFVRNLTADVDV